jgi:hypothetical protein
MQLDGMKNDKMCGICSTLKETIHAQNVGLGNFTRRDSSRQLDVNWINVLKCI